MAQKKYKFISLSHDSLESMSQIVRGLFTMWSFMDSREFSRTIIIMRLPGLLSYSPP